MPDLKLDEPQQGAGQPASTAARSGSPGQPGSAPQSPSTSARAARAVRSLWRGNRLFIIVAAISLLPRILAALAYRPAMLTADSFLYMQEAVKGTLGELRPSGYSFFISLLQEVPHPLLAVTTVQHLMGIAIAAVVYGLLRYWGLPAWGSVLAAFPILFDAREIALESYILPDTVYTLVIIVVVALLIRRNTPKLWHCALAGLLMAYVTVLRGNGLPLAVVVALYLLVRRVGWRAFAAGAIAFVLPVLGYVLAFHANYGQYNITDSDGVFLWSRTTSFANCAIIKPPANLVPLCPNGSDNPPPKAPAWSISALVNAKAPTDYLWESSAWWRHDAHPGINPYNNKLGEKFAIDAIKAQPLGYARTVGEDMALLFMKNDRPQNLLTLGFTTQLHVAHLPSYYVHDIHAYARTDSNTYIVQPYGYFLFLYQMPVYFPGFVFFAAFVAGLVAIIRRRRNWGGPAALPWVIAVLSILLPAMLTQSLYRYALTAVPLACLAAGLAFVRRPDPAPAMAAGPAAMPAGSAATAAAPRFGSSASTQPETTQPETTQPGSAQPGSARPESTQTGGTQPGGTSQGTAEQNGTWQYEAAQPWDAQDSIVQDSTGPTWDAQEDAGTSWPPQDTAAHDTASPPWDAQNTAGHDTASPPWDAQDAAGHDTASPPWDAQDGAGQENAGQATATDQTGWTASGPSAAGLPPAADPAPPQAATQDDPPDDHVNPDI